MNNLTADDLAGAAVKRDANHGDEQETLLDAVVMMVDDEPINIEVTQVYLEEAGFTKFVSTSDPQEALTLLTERRPDVLLLDLMMPRSAVSTS